MIHRETPPPMGSIIGNGGSVFGKGRTLSEYRNPPLSAKEFATAFLAKRFHLPAHRARLVCELAGIGGRIS